MNSAFNATKIINLCLVESKLLLFEVYDIENL